MTLFTLACISGLIICVTTAYIMESYCNRYSLNAGQRFGMVILYLFIIVIVFSAIGKYVP